MIEEPHYLYTVYKFILICMYTVYIYFIFIHIDMFTQHYGDTYTLQHMHPRIMTPRDARSKQVVCGSPTLS